MKLNYKLLNKLVSCVFILSLFFQNCSNVDVPNVQEEQTNNTQAVGSKLSIRQQTEPTSSNVLAQLTLQNDTQPTPILRQKPITAEAQYNQRCTYQDNLGDRQDYSTAPAGFNWVDVTDRLTGGKPANIIKIRPMDSVGIGQYNKKIQVLDTYLGVSETQDGINWGLLPAVSNISRLTYYDFTYFPPDPSNPLLRPIGQRFVATSAGIFQLAENQLAWKQINQNLPLDKFETIGISCFDNMLVCGVRSKSASTSYASSIYAANISYNSTNHEYSFEWKLYQSFTLPSYVSRMYFYSNLVKLQNNQVVDLRTGKSLIDSAVTIGNYSNHFYISTLSDLYLYYNSQLIKLTSPSIPNPTDISSIGQSDSALYIGTVRQGIFASGLPTPGYMDNSLSTQFPNFPHDGSNYCSVYGIAGVSYKSFISALVDVKGQFKVYSCIPATTTYDRMPCKL